MSAAKSYNDSLRMLEAGDSEQAAVLAQLATVDQLVTIADQLRQLVVELADLGRAVRFVVAP